MIIAKWNPTTEKYDYIGGLTEVVKRYVQNAIPSSLPANGGNAQTVNGHTVKSDVPANALFTDTVYTHPDYTAITGVPAADQTPAFGESFTVTQPVSDDAGHITAMNSKTVTIPSTPADESNAGLVTAGKQHFAGYKTFDGQVGIRTGEAVGTMPDTDRHRHLFFIDDTLSKWFGDVRCCIRGSNVSEDGVVEMIILSQSNDNTGSNFIRVRSTNNNSANFVQVGTPTAASSSCLRNLASGTEEANTTNCPRGCWYGKHD